MKKTFAILALAVLGISAANAGVHFGINVGIPMPAPVVVAPAPVVVASAPVVVTPTTLAPVVDAVPACPTPGYIWMGGKWAWYDKYWAWTRGNWGPASGWEHTRLDYDRHRGYAYHPERVDNVHAGFHPDRARR